MSHQKPILQQMDRLGKELLATAEQLLQLTSQVFSGEELAAIQAKQELLVNKLIELDATFHEEENSHPHDTTGLLQCLERFQQLNNSFVENVKQSKGVIQFETADMERMHEAVMAIKKRHKKSHK